jgi:uncharacterized membrane protein YdjX (TVP38/TMEM64 family)
LLATGQLGQFRHYLLSLGHWAPVVSIALMVAEALAIPVPVTIIMVANGLVFGVWRGMLVSLAGGLVGALAAYWIGRFVGRAVLERVLPDASLRMADKLMAKYGRWAIVLERWIPGVPGDPVSYIAGLTQMPTLSFFALTIVGLVPANLAAAYLGSQVAGDVPRRYWISGLVIVAAAWVGWRTTRRRQQRQASGRTKPEQLVIDRESSVAPPPSS